MVPIGPMSKRGCIKGYHMVRSIGGNGEELPCMDNSMPILGRNPVHKLALREFCPTILKKELYLRFGRLVDDF